MTLNAQPACPAFLDRADALRLLSQEPELFVVYDRNVDWVAEELLGGLPIRAKIALEASEEAKTPETALAVCRQLLGCDATRRALLVAVGGGFITDVTGFAAAIYKRGIRYANVPTTLLGQVDAAIGGKTGVNLDGYKNMLGAFHMPEFTLLAPEFLKTLPARQWRCGLAELLKTFLIADADAYNSLLSTLPCAKTLENEHGSANIAASCTKTPENEHEPAKIATPCTKMAENEHEPAKIAAPCAKTAENEHALAKIVTPCAKTADNEHGLAKIAAPCAKTAENEHAPAEWVRQAARIKAAIVARDPYEEGERAVLNLGHSFGHAIEYLALQKGADILHGEAVAMGIVLAALVSEGLGEAPKGLARRLAEDFASVGLPTQSPYPVEELLEALQKDKKAAGNQIKFVLLRAPGNVFLHSMTPQEAYDCYLRSR